MAFDWSVGTIFIILLTIFVVFTMVMFYVGVNPDIAEGWATGIYKLWSFFTKPIVT